MVESHGAVLLGPGSARPLMESQPERITKVRKETEVVGLGDLPCHVFVKPGLIKMFSWSRTLEWRWKHSLFESVVGHVLCGGTNRKSSQSRGRVSGNLYRRTDSLGPSSEAG